MGQNGVRIMAYCNGIVSDLTTVVTTQDGWPTADR